MLFLKVFQIFVIFQECKKILNRDGGYSFIPGVGVRKINTLISLSIGNDLSWVAVIDDDPKEGGKDSRNKFNEIKDFIFDGNEESAREKIYTLDGIVGVENMFTPDDLKLVDPQIRLDDKNDNVKSVGKNRKVLFSTRFFQKVTNGEITQDHISLVAKENFKTVFNFIGE